MEIFVSICINIFTYKKRFQKNLTSGVLDPCLGPWYAEKWSPEKWFPGKMVPGKMVREKNGPRKNGPRKIGPWKNVLQKLFSVQRMLGNLNDFLIFINCFHYTHKKMFDVYVTILHMHQSVQH